MPSFSASSFLVIQFMQGNGEGVSGQQGISGHGSSFRSLGAVFVNNCTALESSKVGYIRMCTYHNLEKLLTEGMRGHECHVRPWN